MDPLFVLVYGDFHLQETSPCIDAGDPANPPDPDNTIADQGALYFIPPAVAIDLTPHNLPILIPGGGGSFDFDVLIENITDSTATFDVWTDVLTPTGSVVGPILLRTNLSLPVGGSAMRTLTQNVPGGAPAGYYSYNGYVGFYPYGIMNGDYFNFAKLSDDSGPTQNQSWEVFGWEEEVVQSSAPAEFSLYSVYPNPFNPMTTLSYNLPQVSHVSLIIYDVRGSEVARLVDRGSPAGEYTATFDGSHCPSGVYFARLTANDLQQTQKLLLVK